MDRLAETIVAWHNRHPLARRIRASDVHTIGVVALPFMRSTPASPGADAREPVLTDVVTPEVAPPGSASLNAAMGATLSQAPAPGSTLKGLDGLSRLLALVPGKAAPLAWAAFEEAFLPGVSTRAVERFALGHAYPEPPASRDALPWRVVQVKANPGEGWPFELYLLSAGIDAGPARTRVLAGRGYPAAIMGRRALDPLRLALTGLTLIALGGIGAALYVWQGRPSAPEATSSEPGAASAAMPSSSAASDGLPTSILALPKAPEPAASATDAGAAAAASAVTPPLDAGTGEDTPDIRPRLVPTLRSRDGRPRPALRASEAEAEAQATARETPATPAERPASAGSPAPAPRETPLAKPVAASSPPSEPPTQEARLKRLAQAPNTAVVALVGPPGSRADAEAQLKKMQAGLVGMVAEPDALQAQVLETPVGWRATIWPFTSREQAQLINAVLVARGLKTKAVDF